MVRIDIITKNIGGDEELAEALREIVAQIEEGFVEGRLTLDDEECAWAVNDPEFMK